MCSLECSSGARPGAALKGGGRSTCYRRVVGQEAQGGRHEALTPWLLGDGGPEGGPPRTWPWEAGQADPEARSLEGQWLPCGDRGHGKKRMVGEAVVWARDACGKRDHCKRRPGCVRAFRTGCWDLASPACAGACARVCAQGEGAEKRQDLLMSRRNRHTRLPQHGSLRQAEKIVVFKRLRGMYRSNFSSRRRLFECV